MSRKCICAVVLMVVLMLLCLPALSFADDPVNETETSFVFPPSLSEIEGAAFSNTAVTTIIFPDGFLSVEDEAFMGADFLIDVYVPSTTVYIADSAFPQNDILTIHGIDGSYAEEWAKLHLVTFVVDDIWNTAVEPDTSSQANETPMTHNHSVVKPHKIMIAHDREEDEGISMRPQERSELNPIDYRFP